MTITLKEKFKNIYIVFDIAFLLLEFLWRPETGSVGDWTEVFELVTRFLRGQIQYGGVPRFLVREKMRVVQYCRMYSIGTIREVHAAIMRETG